MPKKKPPSEWYVDQSVRVGSDWGVVREVREGTLLVRLDGVEEIWSIDIIEEKR